MLVSVLGSRRIGMVARRSVVVASLKTCIASHLEILRALEHR